MLRNWNIIIVYLNSNINFCYFLLMKCIQWIIFFIYNTVITILYELEYSIVIYLLIDLIIYFDEKHSISYIEYIIFVNNSISTKASKNKSILCIKL